ncbi:hypothetical protein NQZ68_029725 [Dissostichus eleginoides]|nr:hypothetical protein NQZ68_029725 [Dissostichus eleginoides]
MRKLKSPWRTNICPLPVNGPTGGTGGILPGAEELFPGSVELRSAVRTPLKETLLPVDGLRDPASFYREEQEGEEPEHQEGEEPEQQEGEEADEQLIL